MLTQKQREEFARFGVVRRIPVLSRADAAVLCDECRTLVALRGGAPRTIDVRQMHLHFPWAYRLASHSKVLDAVEDVLGPDLLVWATELFAKKAGDESLVIGWHRDRKYMGFRGSRVVTAWVSLARSFVDNGCLQVVLEEDRQERSKASGTARESAPSESGVTNLLLEPGEMSLHDADVHHGSGPNVSPEDRVGFAIRFVGPQSASVHGRPPALLVRGVATGDFFTLVDPPHFDDVTTSLSGMKESANRHFEAMLENITNQEPFDE